MEFYIDMISRELEVRKKEHQADVKYNRKSPALSRVNYNENIINFDGMKRIRSLYIRSIHPGSHRNSNMRFATKKYLSNYRNLKELVKKSFPMTDDR